MDTSERPVPLAVATARGAGWIVGWRFATRLLGIANMLVLARLLVPGDFGLVAIATSFSQAVDALGEIGVTAALIREAVLDKAMYDTGFTLNALRGALTTLVLVLAAQPVAAFFGEPRLVHIMMALAAAMLLSSLENIGIVEFNRALAFDKEFVLFVVPRIAGIVLGVFVAWYLRSYWALVVGILTTRCLRAALSYMMHPYRPSFSLLAWRRMLGFSTWAWVLAITSLIRDRIDAFVIGRLLGPAQVGIYSMGLEIGFAASVELVVPLSRALFPSFSRLRNRAENISDAYFRVISAALLVSMPASTGIALVAEPLVHIAFGTRWLPAVPVIQIFALVGILKVIATISGTLLTVYGLQAVQWRIVSVSLIVRLVLMIVLVTRFGLLGGAFAAAASSMLDEIMYLFVTFRRFHVSANALLYSNWRCLLGVSIMTVSVLLTERWYRGADQLPVGSTGMALEVFVGVVSYVTVVLVAWLAAGRPSGAEYYALGVLRAVGRSLLARWKTPR